MHFDLWLTTPHSLEAAGKAPSHVFCVGRGRELSKLNTKRYVQSTQCWQFDYVCKNVT